MLPLFPSYIESANFPKISFIDLIASSFAGIGISVKSGSQLVSSIEITGIFNLMHS